MVVGFAASLMQYVLGPLYLSWNPLLWNCFAAKLHGQLSKPVNETIDLKQMIFMKVGDMLKVMFV